VSDPRDERWLRRGDRAYQDLTDRPFRTGAKGIAFLLIGGLLLAAAFGVANWIGAWGGEAKRVASPQNVREQNTSVIGDWEALQQQAGNACDAKSQAGGEGSPTLVEDPEFAYAATYRSTAADYNRRMANLYEAQTIRNLPLPSNLKSYPRTAPSLRSMKRSVC